MSGKLSDSAVEILLHVKAHPGQLPKIEGKVGGQLIIAKRNQERSKQKLIDDGYLTPAKHGRVYISNKAETYLSQLDQAPE